MGEITVPVLIMIKLMSALGGRSMVFTNGTDTDTLVKYVMVSQSNLEHTPLLDRLGSPVFSL